MSDQWGTGLPDGQFDCPSCNTLSDIDEVAALGGRCPVCGKYDTETDVGKHYGAADEGSRGWHHTASTDGIRYAHVVEADVADDLMRLAGVVPGPGDLHVPIEELWSYRQGEVDPGSPYDAKKLQDLEDGGVRDGIHTPVTVTTDGAKAVISDGLHRVWWARQNGVSHVPVVVEPPSFDLSHEGSDVGPALASHLKSCHAARLAAVNQGLVDRLHDEFHQWWENKQNLDTDPASADYWKGNGVSEPIQYWPHIEEFLSHKYPASNRWHDMGMEEAGHILDGHKPMPYQVQSGADTTPYETGPEAIATYGYDPKEIAAGMLLLHNRSNPLRGDMLPQDQARLNDIFQKRQQMQRDYEQRTKTAMPRQDAYDAGVLERNFGGHPDQAPPFPGPWFHGSPEKLEVGDILHPGTAKNYEYDDDWKPREGWVFMDLDARRAKMWAGQAARQRQMPHDAPTYVYHVEPLDEGPWPWNESPYMGYASPRARVVERRHVDEMGDWDQQPQYGPRRKRDISPLPERLQAQGREKTAMPMPLPEGVTFKYHPELVWSPGVTAHLPDGRQVGSLEWYDDDHVMVDLGTRRPGEIDRIQVPEDQRGQSIATSMFDFAKQHEPRLHHSDILTEDGRGWSEYEQSRDKSPMPKRFAMPTVYHGTDPKSAQSILQNGFSPGGWGDKSFFSTEPQDAASYGESLLSVDIPDDEWERTERHPWMHHETAEIDPHRLQELGIKPRLLDEVPHRPLTGPPVWPKVYRKNPDQTWQEGRPVDQVARQIDTDDDLTQMRGVPDWPKGTFDAGTGTYWDVDFGDGPIPVHQRDLYT